MPLNKDHPKKPLPIPNAHTNWQPYHPIPTNPTQADELLDNMATYITNRAIGTNATIASMLAEDLRELERLLYGDGNHRPPGASRHQCPPLNPT